MINYLVHDILGNYLAQVLLTATALGVRTSKNVYRRWDTRRRDASIDITMMTPRSEPDDGERGTAGEIYPESIKRRPDDDE
jgi:hypothetical protein